jgi:tripartite-type tricarboxylate transporter receptor subunit TctC
MKLRIVSAAAALAAFGGLHLPAQGQGFKPTRPVEAVVHTGPGGGSDVLARAVALRTEDRRGGEESRYGCI